MKNTFKKYWSVLLTLLLSVVSLCFIQWNSIIQSRQNEVYKTSQQKIVVTFNQKTTTTEASNELKNIITNSSFTKKEHIKVNVETKQELQKFLAQNNIKIDKKNINIAFVISNFKSESDYTQLLDALNSEKRHDSNISLVESIKANNVNAQDDNHKIAFVATIVIAILLLSVIVTLRTNALTEDYVLSILNGKSFAQTVTTQTLWLFTLSFVTVALTLVIFGLFSNLTGNSLNIVYLTSNSMLLGSGIGLSVYTSLLQWIIAKFKISKKVTW